MELSLIAKTLYCFEELATVTEFIFSVSTQIVSASGVLEKAVLGFPFASLPEVLTVKEETVPAPVSTSFVSTRVVSVHVRIRESDEVAVAFAF